MLLYSFVICYNPIDINNYCAKVVFYTNYLLKWHISILENYKFTLSIIFIFIKNKPYYVQKNFSVICNF